MSGLNYCKVFWAWEIANCELLLLQCWDCIYVDLIAIDIRTFAYHYCALSSLYPFPGCLVVFDPPAEHRQIATSSLLSLVSCFYYVHVYEPRRNMSETLKEIGSTVAKLRTLLSETKKDLLRVQGLQDVLTSSLDVLWESTNILIQDQRFWKETLALVASGKVLSVAAQAEHALDVAGDVGREKSWISSGSDYCLWIGKGVVGLCGGGDYDETTSSTRMKAAAQLFGKGLTIGYNGMLTTIRRDEFSGLRSCDRCPCSHFTGRVDQWPTERAIVSIFDRVFDKI